MRFPSFPTDFVVETPTDAFTIRHVRQRWIREGKSHGWAVTEFANGRYMAAMRRASPATFIATETKHETAEQAWQALRDLARADGIVE